MKTDLKIRNKMAQIFVDMNVGESKRVRLTEMVPLLKEVNDTPLIGTQSDLSKMPTALSLT